VEICLKDRFLDQDSYYFLHYHSLIWGLFDPKGERWAHRELISEKFPNNPDHFFPSFGFDIKKNIKNILKYINPLAKLNASKEKGKSRLKNIRNGPRLSLDF